MTDSTVKDVSSATFHADVVEASRTRPVVVDFWAPWCGPCRMLGPLLERQAAAANGAWTLVKINVDENGDLAARYGVQGIPAVKGFRDGQVVAEFVGAQPEAMVRRFLDRLLPSAADVAASEGRQSAAAGDTVGAEQAFRRALDEQPDHAQALLGLGRLLADSGRADEAIQALEALLPNSAEAREAAPVLAQLRLSAGTDDLPSSEQVEETLRSDPLDAAANLARGQALAARGAYADALPHLLTALQQDRSLRDGEARSAMLAIFDLLGPDDPLTLDYRRKLSSALYV